MTWTLGKQIRDQGAHTAIGAIAGSLAFYSPWTLPVGVFLIAAIGWREGKQFPSNRTSTTPFWRALGGWDPWLDGLFYGVGFAFGTFIV